MVVDYIGFHSGFSDLLSYWYSIGFLSLYEFLDLSFIQHWLVLNAYSKRINKGGGFSKPENT